MVTVTVLVVSIILIIVIVNTWNVPADTTLMKQTSIDHCVRTADLAWARLASELEILLYKPDNISDTLAFVKDLSILQGMLMSVVNSERLERAITEYVKDYYVAIINNAKFNPNTEETLSSVTQYPWKHNTDLLELARIDVEQKRIPTASMNKLHSNMHDVAEGLLYL